MYLSITQQVKTHLQFITKNAGRSLDEFNLCQSAGANNALNNLFNESRTEIFRFKISFNK